MVENNTSATFTEADCQKQLSLSRSTKSNGTRISKDPVKITNRLSQDKNAFYDYEAIFRNC